MDSRIMHKRMRRFDAAMALSAIWLLVFVTAYATRLPAVSTMESAFLLIGDSKLFSNGVGISLLLLFCSDWFEQRRVGNLRGLLKSVFVPMMALVALFAVVVCVSSMGLDTWSRAIVQIADDQRSAVVVYMPFMPITPGMVDLLTPYQAFIRQLCLFTVQLTFYVLLSGLLYAFCKGKRTRICVLLAFHLMGQYALSTWPSWIGLVPQSYFYLQNYQPYSPLPTQYDISSFRNILLVMGMMLVLFSTVHIARKRRGHDHESQS